mmetsp:Transcript_17406/g.36120  ORF Transcript_17406/g.36120 Transcript_17406/m.36120 type:complete len:297 (-) Transcript_17406:774-1664(-)
MLMESSARERTRELRGAKTSLGFLLSREDEHLAGNRPGTPRNGTGFKVPALTALADAAMAANGDQSEPRTPTSQHLSRPQEIAQDLTGVANGFNMHVHGFSDDLHKELSESSGSGYRRKSHGVSLKASEGDHRSLDKRKRLNRTYTAPTARGLHCPSPSSGQSGRQSVDDTPTRDSKGSASQDEKKERRRLKNRESAQRSRARRIVKLENLEKVVSTLSDENRKLKDEVQRLEASTARMGGNTSQTRAPSGPEFFDVAEPVASMIGKKRITGEEAASLLNTLALKSGLTVNLPSRH